MERDWCKLDGLKTLTLDDVARGNEFLDAVMASEAEAKRRREAREANGR